MKRLPAILVVAAAIAAACFLFRPTASAVPTFRAGELPQLAYEKRIENSSVRVLLRFPAKPTADPLVWEYRPSAFGMVPPSIRLQFDEPPTAPVRAVVGHVEGFQLDLHRRPSGIPGLVVLTSCRPVSP